MKATLFGTAVALGMILAPCAALASDLLPGTVIGTGSAEAANTPRDATTLNGGPSQNLGIVHVIPGGGVSVVGWSAGVQRGAQPGLTLNSDLILGRGETFASAAVTATMRYSFMITGQGDLPYVAISIHELGAVSHSDFMTGESASSTSRLSITGGTHTPADAKMELGFGFDGGVNFVALEDHAESTRTDAPQISFAGTGTSFDETFDALFLTNTLYTVTMDVAISDLFEGSVTNVEHNQRFSAFLDPTFAFVNAADAGRYGFVFSDGFGGGPAATPPGGVPEPATWAMLIAGFGLTGAALRGRVRQAGVVS